MNRLTIGALSRETGCKIETIRYYERIGLLRAPPRSAGGHRIYDRDDFGRLGFVRRARELGFSLDDIRALLGLVDGADFSCAEVKAVTVEHLASVEAKIKDLRTIAGVLRDMAARCDGGETPDCPIIEALYP